MTAINFIFQADQINVFTDTLSSFGEDKGPRSFVTKLFPLLHLNGIICGTGLHPFITEWMLAANTQILVRDMIHLDQFAPQALPLLWAKYIASPDFGKDYTATIYHFGYDTNQERFRGFAYRSTANFKSEELGYGVGMKPVPADISLPDALEMPDDMISLMERQKAEDELRPVAERVCIGGDIHWFHMSAETMFLKTCHRFPDFEKMYEIMCEGIE